MSKILITGATGLIGGEITRQLVAKGVPARVLLRSTSKDNSFNELVDVSIGDYADSDALKVALSGIERLFLASFDMPEVVMQQANVLSMAKQCGVNHVVRMSTIGIEEWQHLPV